jgi:N6-L-threonylcarbamoyladenine synthase
MTRADGALLLAIETSCDETAAALVTRDGSIRSSIVSSQAALHARYGGVVPEVASRRHLELVTPVVEEALWEAGATLDDVDTVAVTQGPGLVGALLVGLSFAKALAWARGLPLVPVDHLHGHVASLFLAPDPLEPPFACLLASGGHTQVLAVRDHDRVERLGTTLDDAAGEAFDKTAKVLGLGYPGGPQLAALAERGRPGTFRFPRPLTDRPGLDFSFSGLKTAVIVALKDRTLDGQTRADAALAFEEAVVDTLVIKCQRALAASDVGTLVVAGGVGANRRLRARMLAMGERAGVRVVYPRPEYCTDNAAMIALLGELRLAAGQRDGLAIRARARWPMSELGPPGVSA